MAENAHTVRVGNKGFGRLNGGLKNGRKIRILTWSLNSSMGVRTHRDCENLKKQLQVLGFELQFWAFEL